MPISVTCSSCGTLVPAGDRFCGTCGNPITGSAVLSGDPSRFDPWAELLQRLRQATIGEYEIKGELGRGGMAAVFLAHDLQLNRKVAVKVMLPGLVYGDRMWDRFLAEARTAAKLDHPNIVYIHSVKEKDRFLYFVMKYIDGCARLDDLRALNSTSKLPVPVAQTILVEAARALDYAHKEGVVHRDIKPANIMIDQKGNAIVWILHRARDGTSQHFTQTGATIGTPAYMSPEQCHGRETTAASDQYSLGILAYEMLAGTPPFSGSPIELQLAHMQDAPAPLRDLRPDLSLELSGAVMRMLEKDASARWPSLHHLIPIFGRGLEAHDDSPRNHLVSLVRAGTPRNRSFPATPVSPAPGTGRNTPFEARTPVADFHVRPSAPTTPLPVASMRAQLDAAQRKAAEARAAGATAPDPSKASGPHDAPTHVSAPRVVIPATRTKEIGQDEIPGRLLDDVRARRAAGPPFRRTRHTECAAAAAHGADRGRRCARRRTRIRRDAHGQVRAAETRVRGAGSCRRQHARDTRQCRVRRSSPRSAIP